MKRWSYLVYNWPSARASFEVEDKLNSLGKEGWELVCILPRIIGNEINVYTFKRQIV